MLNFDELSVLLFVLIETLYKYYHCIISCAWLLPELTLRSDLCWLIWCADQTDSFDWMVWSHSVCFVRLSVSTGGSKGEAEEMFRVELQLLSRRNCYIPCYTFHFPWEFMWYKSCFDCNSLYQYGCIEFFFLFTFLFVITLCAISSFYWLHLK